MEINRKWVMPNKNTFSIKPIDELIGKYINSFENKDTMVLVDPFANTNRIGDKYGVKEITNDLNEEYNTDYHMDALEFLKTLDTNSVDMLLWDPPYCYDEKTEIFTNDGWKNVSKITRKDCVATLNTETNQLEWNNPTDVIERFYNGTMVNIESQSISLLVTPNHRCYVKNSFYGNYKWLFAQDLFEESQTQWFKKSCDFEGQEVPFFFLPKVKLNGHNIYNEKVKEDKKIPMDLWLKFLGLFISEGYCKTNRIKKDGTVKYDYTISISQTKPNTRKIIEEVLDELGYKYQKSEKDYRISDKQLYTYLSQFKNSQNMFIPNDFKNLSKRQLQILIDYLMLGDGTNITYSKYNKKANKTYHYTTNHYYTSSNKLMNDFCEIAIKAGHAITVRNKKQEKDYMAYDIHLLKAKDFRVNKKDCNKKYQFKGQIYCVTVKNSTVLVKRNGRVFWCGNSPRQVSECYKEFDMTVNFKTTQASYWTNQKKEISRILKPNGIVVTCSWNSGGVGKKYGFDIQEILLVAHGGWHNDTIVVVDKKTDT